MVDICLPLAAYALGDGERDSIELCRQVEGVEALVTDDYLAFVAATRLDLKAWMLPDLVVKLAKRGSLTVRVAAAILETVRPRYRTGVIEHSRAQLEVEETHGESCGAG